MSYKMITPMQWRYMQNLIQQNITTTSMREKINYILYKRHIPLTNKLVKEFKKFHKYKSKLIQYKDYQQYAHIGLLHAIKNYNGKSLFYKYARTYIFGSLYKCMTHHYPITKQKSFQRQTRKIMKKYTFESCGVQNGVTGNNWYLGKSDYIKSNLGFENYEDKRNIWILINSLPPLSRRILHYKFDYNFNVIHSNRNISYYFGCSEETIRKHLKLAILYIIQNI
jgi:RNA polymerase sigma factor (sigma-70 family)